MLKLELNCLGRIWTASRLAKLFLLVVLGMAADSVWAAPANDNFAQAAVISGNSGTTNGSNVGATSEPNEPVDAGTGGGKSVWYAWKANFTGTMMFYTEGSAFDTVMGVYTGTNVTNLTLVAQNDDVSFPTDLSSVTMFPVTNGVTYYISVDGNEGDSGNLVLTWRATGAFSAGVFTFASENIDTSTEQAFAGFPVYEVGADEESSPDGPVNADWMRNFGPRVRVIRNLGTAGRVTVNYTITNILYTNTYFTNVFGTNIYQTNSDGSFSNVLITNIYAINNYQTYFNGSFNFILYTNSFQIAITNVSSGTKTLVSSNLVQMGTNLVPPFGIACLNTTNTGAVTNGVIVSTITTNIFCNPAAITITNVPSAVPRQDYLPLTSSVTLNDYQVGEWIPYSVFDTGPGNGTTNFNPQSLVNHLVLININSVKLDPNESSSLAAPQLGNSTALVEIMNTHTMFVDPRVTTNSMANFVKSVVWMDEYPTYNSANAFAPATNARLARIFVRRTGTDSTTGLTVNYTIDQNVPEVPGPADTLDSVFITPSIPLQPGSDYATPPNSDPSSKEQVRFPQITGTLSWGAQDYVDKVIDIPITNDPTVQFNEDIKVEIWNKFDVNIGQLKNATVTILFNDQPAGAVDRAHNPNHTQGTIPPVNDFPGAGSSNNTVYAVTIQPNNQTIIAGDFLTYNTISRSRIARMNADGSLDNSFLTAPNSGANGTITCLALQSNGPVIIGGSFGSFNGFARPYVARLNADGSLDTNFITGTGPNNSVLAAVLQPDGRVLIAGNFTFISSTNCNYIARLNTNGSLDTTFNAGVGPNAAVNAIALQNDGKIVIGGQFTTIDGTNFSHIARLNADGTLDTTFNPGPGSDQQVRSLAEQPDGKVVVGGAFTTINLLARNSIARLNSDGSTDTTFDPGTGADGVVYTLALQPDGGVLVGGSFMTYNGTRRVGVARLYSDGTLDTTFLDTGYNQFAGLINPLNNQAVQPRNFLFAIAEQQDGNVIIGGRFSQVGGGISYTTHDLDGFTASAIGLYARDNIAPRLNVARLIGGSTPGPGNIGLSYSSYSVEKANQSYYVAATRNNGALGTATASIQPSPSHAGNGAATQGQDYIQTVLNPTWGYSGTWNVSDALFGPDYTPVALVPLFSLTPLPNASIQIIDNPQSSGDLSLTLQVSQPTGSLTLGGEPISTGVALGLAQAPMTIVDDSVPAGQVSFSSMQFFVNESGTNALITVVRTNGSTGPLSVQFQTIPGTAFPGSTNDYFATNGTLTFNSGDTVATFTVAIVDNTIVRPDRSLTLNLFNPSPSTGLGAITNATLTIINDNYVAGQLSFSISNYTVLQNAKFAPITVTRLGGSQGTVTINYSTSDGTASNNLDYYTTNGVLTWNSGDSAVKTFNVPILNSGLVTSNLLLNLTLSNPIVNGSPNTNIIGQFTNATLTIIDQNAYGNPTLSASSYTVNEDAGVAVITVNRLGGNSQTITVDYSTTDGTAVAGSDYTAVSGTLTFTNGQFSQSFTVPIINATLQTNNGDYFMVSLSNPTPTSGPGGGVTLGTPNTAPVTIIANQVVNNSPGASDTTFNANAGFNSTVYSIALQPDGSLVAGGDFTQANGVSRNRIARLDVNGQLDVKFSSSSAGANGSVRDVLLQTDGQIVIGGLFSAVNNVNFNYLARLNYDGSLDSTFNPGVGPDNPVFAIAETFNGGFNNNNRELIIGGSFASVQGISYRSIAEINEDGSVNTNFLAAGANSTVYALAVYSTNDVNTGKILLGGDFTSVNGIPMNHIARLNADGSLDTTFTGNASDSVRAIAIQLDGNILIGGLFTSVDNVPLNYIARLNPDGSLDPNFNVGVGANDAVTTIAVQQDNSILVGGSFTEANGVTRNRLTRLHSDGSVDAGINFGSGANDFVDTIVVQPDSKVLIGGGFTQYDGANKPHIDRIFGGSVTGEGAVQFPMASFQINQNSQGSTNVAITIERVGGTGGNGPVSVLFSTSDGTARAGVDYTAVTKLVTFNIGETFQTVTIPVMPDPTNFGQLTVNLTLSNPTSGDPSTFAPLGGQSLATLNIIGANSTVSFSSANYSVTKNTPSGGIAITVQRNGSTVGTSSVDFQTTTNGTAVAGVDYTPITNVTLTFPPGISNQTVTVPVINNGLLEGNLTVGMALLNPTNTALDTALPTIATLTIVDNSQSPGTFAFAATSYTIAENATNAIITVIRTNGSLGQVSVNYSTGGGTALPGVDYAPTNGALTFIDGQTTRTFSVGLLNNTNATSDVSVNLTLTPINGQPQVSGPATVPLTILDENLDVSFAQAGYVVDENAGSVTVVVNRTGTTNGTISVNYATTNGTALAGLNYVSTSGTLTFQPGQTQQSFIIPIHDDPDITGNLIFLVNLFKTNNNSIQLINPATTAITVLDDDSGFKLAAATNDFGISTNSVPKSATNVVISVVRIGNTANTASVNFATLSSGTATTASYVPTNGSLAFASGQVSNSFSIQVKNDNTIDGNLTVDYALSQPSTNVQLLAPSSGELTIVDTVAGFSFSSPTYTVTENGNFAVITVVRSGVTNTTVAVNYTTSDGTGHAPSQYKTTSGTLVFTNGVTSQTFSVPIIDNNVIGGSETVNLILSNPSTSAVLVNPNAATLTILNNDGSLIVQAGSAVIVPTNGVIQPNTTATVLLSLLNSAGATATNVNATLLATNGITPQSPSTQSYGNLFSGGPSTFRPFSFTATGTNGGQLLLVLQMTYDGTNTSQVTYVYTMGTTTNRFTNGSPIIINDVAAASPYPAKINISSLVGVISQISATVSNVTHTYAGDIDILLVGPTGQKELLMEQDGSSNGLTGVTLTFSSGVTNRLTTGPITSGTYAASPTVTGIPFYPGSGVPPPAGPYTANLADFIGTNPNGVWSLYVQDSKVLDSGVISNGWSLAISTLNTVAPNNDLVVGLTGNSAVVVNSNLTYVISVTNAGPSPATGVLLTNVLPAGATLVSVTQSQGTHVTATNGVITFSLGSLATNGTASATVVITSPTIGLVTNTVSIGGNEIEDNLFNNSATLVSTIVSPTVDLAIGGSIFPNPVYLTNTLTIAVTVTNFGPATATAAYVTNTMPLGVKFVSDSAIGGSVINADGSITSFLGDLGSGQVTNFTVVVRPTLAGNASYLFGVNSSVVDSLKGNNTFEVKSVATGLPLNVARGSGNTLTFSWPDTGSGSYALQYATSLTPPVVWTTITTSPTLMNGVNTLSVPVTGGSKYFRLISQ